MMKYSRMIPLYFTDSELVALESINNIIESTEIKLDEISESIRKIRRET